MDNPKSSVENALDESWFTRMMAHGEYNATRFLCATVGNCIQLQTLQEMFTIFQTRNNLGKKGVCVIENASPHVVRGLIDSWRLDEAFFVAHAFNRPMSEIWTNHQKNDQPLRTWRSLEGIYIQDGVTLDPVHLKQGRSNYWDREVDNELRKSRVDNSTRISYCKIAGTGWCKVYRIDICWKQS